MTNKFRNSLITILIMEITIHVNLKQDIINQWQALAIIVDNFNNHQIIRRIKLSNLILQCCYLASKKVTRIGDISAKVQRTNTGIYLKDKNVLYMAVLKKKIYTSKLNKVSCFSLFSRNAKVCIAKTVNLLLSYINFQKFLKESSASKSIIGGIKIFTFFVVLRKVIILSFVNSHPEM